MRDEELGYQLKQAYHLLSWKILVFLKANPGVIDMRGNQEVFEAVKKIQIKRFLAKMPGETEENVSDYIDVISDLEAKRYGENIHVSQENMELFRPSTERNDKKRTELLIHLLLFGLK